ncbi:hypothetical protein [Fluviicola taffensis]|uniref:Uncharacterized protein n=1 Tax=Fluviicola taffensis (strain DSM 16823 / NCIMB 13979 / RW262) TaxID=755732 RepID=F2I929_FLUTR|nr:hypothetical protein [Fluviicola taffensis]AEA42976.1 hypothetical protein Fluta_0975 [Fluviicola taffensis DSM 16823]
MKELLFTFCLALTTCFASGQSKLIDSFNKLPKANRHGYVITKKGESYTADAGTGPCAVLVDNANGFLEFKDTGTGGGTFVFQLALFKNSKKETFIAVNYFAYEDPEQGMIDGGNIHFFQGSKKLVEVTKEVLPDMTTVEDKAYNGNATTIFENYKEGVYEYFELPRNGTTVKFHFGTNSLNYACSNTDENACKIKRSLLVVELYWHKEVGYLSLTK